MVLTLPEQFKIIEAMAPATDAAGRTGDYVSLKNAKRVTVVVHITQGNAATIALTLEQATAVAGTGSKVLTNVVPVWANQDTATSDTLVRQTDAVNFTTSAAVKNKMIVFQVDPATLDVAGGFDCLVLKTGASNVANITSAQYYIETAYPAATPPAATTD